MNEGMEIFKECDFLFFYIFLIKKTFKKNHRIFLKI